MTDIRFSPESLRDLQEIKAYIAEELENPVAADSTVSGILDKIRSLSDFPEMGGRLSAVTGIETGYRYLVCGSYMVFYRIKSGAVLIVRILYGRRNYLDILFEKHS